jgi:hypothetical protein
LRRIDPLNLTADKDDASRFASDIESVTESVVRPVVRRQLHVTLNEGDTRARNQDALELVGDIQVMLLAALDPQPDNGAGPIRDLASYAFRTAVNACHLYLRARFPERTRQENKLRYALKHMNGVAVWQTDAGRWCCGLVGCERDQVAASVTVDASSRVLATRDGYLTAVLQALEQAEGAVALDDLVRSLMEAQGLREVITLSITSRSAEDDDDLRGIDVLASPRTADDDSVERLKRLWSEVMRLSVRHRKALLLNLKHKGNDLLRAFPVCGIAGIRDIARALEFSDTEMAEIWHTLPWDDVRIAEHLMLTRQQVINLRQTARARLFRA